MTSAVVDYEQKRIRAAKNIGLKMGIRAGAIAFMISITPPVIKHTLRNQEIAISTVMATGIIAARASTMMLLRKNSNNRPIRNP